MNLENNMSIGLPPYTIYMIDVLNGIYIGKTNDFRHRISRHISRCHNKDATNHNTPLYKHIRKLEEKGEFKFDESCFQIIEEIKDCDEETIKFYEREWIEFYKEENFKMLNKNRPIINEEQVKEVRKEYDKKYHDKNKDEINRKAREKIANETPQQREERLKKEREYQAKHRAKKKLEKQNLNTNK